MFYWKSDLNESLGGDYYEKQVVTLLHCRF